MRSLTSTSRSFLGSLGGRRRRSISGFSKARVMAPTQSVRQLSEKEYEYLYVYCHANYFSLSYQMMIYIDVSDWKVTQEEQ